MVGATIHLAPIEAERVAIRPADYLDKHAFASYLRACRSVGTIYEAAHKAQIGRVATLPSLVDALKENGFAVTLDPALAGSIQAQAQKIRGALEQMRGVIDALEASLAARKLKLYPFQPEGVAWLRQHAAGILGDDPGLGKTIELLLAVDGRRPVVVIAPALAKGVWAREALKWRPDLRPVVLSGRGSFRWPRPGDVAILNYDILPDVNNLKRPTHLVDRRGERMPDPLPGTVVIADEAHVVKSPKAQRSKRFKILARAALAQPNGCAWLATGTPILNRPPELWTLLSHVRLAEPAFGDWPTFERLFGKAEKNGRVVWEPTPEAAERLRAVMLRRSREEVLPDLPAKTWNHVPVEISGDVKQLADDILAQIRAAGVRIEDALETTKNGMKAEAISRLRAALATAMMPAMLEWIRDREDDGNGPLVVFSAHRAPIDFLATRPGWAVITGDVSPEDRTRLENAFQRGELKGIGLTIKAGGVAITLTKAHRELFVDVEWTPALNKQAEDRCCRIGQPNGVLIDRLVADHELVDRVYQRLLEKQLIIESSVERASVGQGQHAQAEHAALAKLDAVMSAATASSVVRTASAAHAAATPLEQWAATGLRELSATGGWRAKDATFARSLTLALGHGLTMAQWSAAIELVALYRPRPDVVPVVDEDGDLPPF